MAQIILDSNNNLIQGDFDNATLNNRTKLQTTTTNATTNVYVVPNGSSTSAGVSVANNSSLTNASKIVMATNGSTDTQIISGINGSGTYLPLSFYTNNALAGQFTTAGLLSLPGGGITFPATQVPSANANTLDDYEEGTFSPGLTCAIPGTFSYTVSDAEGTYTKIGNVVNFSFLLGWSAISLGTGSGSLQVSGLPFASASTGNFVCPVQTYFVNWVASTTCIVGQVQQSDSKIIIRCLINDGNWETIVITSQTASQQNYIRMSGSYLTA
jgi:hypothetical protein